MEDQEENSTREKTKKNMEDQENNFTREKTKEKMVDQEENSTGEESKECSINIEEYSRKRKYNDEKCLDESFGKRWGISFNMFNLSIIFDLDHFDKYNVIKS